MTHKADFLIIGAGVSGAAAAAELAPSGKVVVLEAESQPGYHSTGRSAALYTPNYGPQVVRQLVLAGNEFYRDPPQGFADHPLLTPRGALTFAAKGAEDKLDQFRNEATPATPIAEIAPERALEMAPLLRREAVARALFDPFVMDMDVAAIHQGFLKMLKARGAEIVADARIERIERKTGAWIVHAKGHDAFEAPILVNAAGAWADEIGAMAGLRPIRLQPKRRTAILIGAAADLAPPDLPAIDDGADGQYVKPQSGLLMASLGDETPSPPCDAQPEDLDIAFIVDWLERVSRIEVKRIEHSWAGLRSFVPDNRPVAGFDESAGNFFWLAGQGGYGIMLAAALGRVTAGLIGKDEMPADLAARGLKPADLAPARCRK